MIAALNRPAIRRLLLVAVVTAFYMTLWPRPQFMERLRVSYADLWFLDTHAVLAASDAAEIGLDPYAPNPLDIHHMPHVYSEWWLHLHQIGLTRDDYLWIGWTLGFSFLALAIAQLKVRSLGEVLWSATFVAAPPILLGFNRGNVDLLIFLILALTVPCLLSRRLAVRWIGVGTLLVATALKFYPLVGVVVLLAPKRPRREIFLQIGSFLILSACSLLRDATMLRGYAADPMVLPPAGYHVFGAGIASQMLAMASWQVLLVAVVAALVVIVCSWRRMPAWPTAEIATADSLRFALGSALIAGCYFATVNYSYRLVFGIWMAPMLWQAWTDARWPRPFRRLGRVTGVLMILELWLDPLLRLPLTTRAALQSPANTIWAARMVAGEQVLAAGLALALVALLTPWARDHLLRAFDRDDLIGIKGSAPRSS